MKSYLLLLLCTFIALTTHTVAQELQSEDFAMLVHVETYKNSKNYVVLSWDVDSNATKYSIIRKLKSEPNFYAKDSVILSANATSYIDSTVEENVVYEYEICKNAKDGNFNRIAIGYVATGVNILPIPFRGKVLILVDQTFETQLDSKLDRFENSLTLDGWYPVRKSVPRAETFDSAKVQITKTIIEEEYYRAGSKLEAVVLVGRVAVPYSGAFKAGTNFSPPDGHPDHGGAWPADAYYGDIVDNFGSPAMFSWTDQAVNMSRNNADSNAVKARSRNENVPFDGKFDNTQLPSAIELQVGRIDFFDMPAFTGKTELQLLENYFDKNNAYRTGQIAVNYKAVVDDNFGARINDIGNFHFAEAFAGSGWRNFASILGPDSVKIGKLFNETEASQHLFSYGTGGGNFTGAGGVGSSQDFVTKKPQSIFMFLFGSYFGDWDHRNAFMRAALASDPQVLTCAWAGRPHWFIHHMTVGETMGYATRIAQSNPLASDPQVGIIMPYYGMGISTVNPVNNQIVRQTTQHFGGNQIHIALMGDPTLRIYEVEPPSALTAIEVDSGVALQWTAPKENIDGYLLYYSNDPKGNFERIPTVIPKTQTSFVHTKSDTGLRYYMVKAHRRTRLNGKAYFNESLGSMSPSLVYTSVNNQAISESLQLSVVPNPIKNTSVVTIYSSLVQDAILSLTDMSGRKIVTKKIENFNSSYSINFETFISKESLANGSYLLQCTIGNVSKTIPIVVQR
jgi:hypothetical protein